jgi:hypothetical protein
MPNDLPSDPQLPAVKNPETWDLAAAPPEVPIGVQGQAIEKFLAEAGPVVPGEASVNEPTIPLASLIPEQVAASPESAPLVEEFKPSDKEWENVKEREFPHAPDPLPDAKAHPAYKPELLERDAEGADDGDWHDVEPGK